MKFWLGVTDNRWFDFNAARGFDEVNFWQPSARAPFSNLPPGTPFLFKLKRPHNHIAGGGRFVRHTTLPLSMAWDVFGQQNGTDSLRHLVELISDNARVRAGAEHVRLDKQPLAAMPAFAGDQPDRDALRWHNDHRFLE